MTDKPINLNPDDPNDLSQNIRKWVDGLSEPIDPAELSKIAFLPGIEVLKQKYPEINLPETVSYQHLSFEAQMQHNKEQIKILKEIRDNTAPLPSMLELIAENHDSQKDILRLVNQIFELATARNREELKSKHWKVIEDINNVVELGEAAGKLILFAEAIFSMASLIIKK